MKLKKKFLVRDILGEIVLVPVGSSDECFSGMITMNEFGKFIWDNIEKNQDEILSLILDEYEVEKSVAEKDLEEFLGCLKKANIIE